LTDDERPEATDVESAKDAGGNSKVSKASNIKEVWFAGSHSDVCVYVPSFRDCILIPLRSGGANSPGKSFHAGNVSLMWMRQEAAECGVLLKPTDMVWTPSDLDYGTSNSLSLGWKISSGSPSSIRYHGAELANMFESRAVGMIDWRI
jgi:hypothetical protein